MISKRIELCTFWNIIEQHVGAIDYIEIEVPRLKPEDKSKLVCLYRDGTYDEKEIE